MPVSLASAPLSATVARPLVAWRLTRGLVHVLVGTLMCAMVFPLLARSRRLGLVRWWARGFLATLGIRVRVDGAWPSAPGRYLLASNHITWLDIFVILSVHPVRFVSKAEVRQWPLAGYLAHCAGTLFLDRTRKRDTVAIGAQMLDVLAEGEAIGIYPEGTTSDGTVLLPFFSPLLQPAVACQADVVPTCVSYLGANGLRNTALAFIGDQTFMQSVAITVRQPSLVVEVRFGTPLAAVGMHRRELTRRVEAAVAELLGVPVDPAWRAPGSTGSSVAESSTPVHSKSREALAASLSASAEPNSRTG